MFILGIGFWACQGKVQVPKPESITNSPKLLVATVSYGTDPESKRWFEYDDKGDIVQQGISDDTVVFDYSKNKIIKRHLNKKTSWDAKTEYVTNEDGCIMSSSIYDENSDEISSFKYLYDGQGYLIRTLQNVLSTDAEYTNEFVYESGNLKEVLMYDSKGAYSSKYAFNYNSDQPNLFNLNLQQISDDIFPNERMGKMNKDKVSQIAQISQEGDTLSLLKYTYNVIEGDSIIRGFQHDVLNEFRTELKYEFKKR